MFIAYGLYPSIDHIVPLAKGGNHTWNNVQLAHHYCNTLKRDKVVNV
jgi:5-methylcytosine-specific restriction endonuclease McrA